MSMILCVWCECVGARSSASEVDHGRGASRRHEAGRQETGPLSNFLPGAEEAGWVPKITLGASKGLLAGVKSG
jgi:hypothetical protein